MKCFVWPKLCGLCGVNIKILLSRMAQKDISTVLHFYRKLMVFLRA